MKSQKTMKLKKGVEVLCKDNEADVPLTCNSQVEAEAKATAMGPGWTAYKGDGPEFYIARRRGVAKYERLLTAKLDNGVTVLAIGGGKFVGQPRFWGGENGESNAARNAKALGPNWMVYRLGEYFFLAPVKQSSLPLITGHA